MTNPQILTKAFKKAEKNGYEVKLPHAHGGTISISKVIEYGIYYKFIFNHKFAQAFFGSAFLKKNGEEVKLKLGYNVFQKILKQKPKLMISSAMLAQYIPAWEYHLKLMVVEEDPIKYLEKFL